MVISDNNKTMTWKSNNYQKMKRKCAGRPFRPRARQLESDEESESSRETKHKTKQEKYEKLKESTSAITRKNKNEQQSNEKPLNKNPYTNPKEIVPLSTQNQPNKQKCPGRLCRPRTQMPNSDEESEKTKQTNN